MIFSEVISRLNFVIRHPNALQPDNIMAYDNAVYALGKVCQFHRDSIKSAQVFPVFGYSLVVNSAVYKFAWVGCLSFSMVIFFVDENPVLYA